MTDEMTVEEWHRRLASVEEDVRVLRAMVADTRENASFLRERGHPEPAAVLDVAAASAETTADEIQAQLDEAREA